MKKNLLILALSLLTFDGFSQSTAGLIAHWDMNGSVNDVSGNGHTGHGLNITPTTGRYGISNTAYSFDGVTSIMTAPYLPDLNITKFSICAIVNVKGFYSGLCQANTIFTRGRPAAGISGSYSLLFDDNAFDNNDCNAIDSTKDVFYSNAASLVPLSAVSRYYTPNIAKNTWYKVVILFNDTTYRTYVNGVLMNTATIATPGVLNGSSTDSISIGNNIFEPSYPYKFKGAIDDIRLFDRMLNDSEIVHYGDSCGRITSQPVNKNVHVGGTATYAVASSIIGVSYQWQQNSGTGFINLSNAGSYSGVTTPTLTVTGVTSSMHNYVYRCILSNTWGCGDTTNLAQLTLGIDNVLIADMVSVYPNPTGNVVYIQLPYTSTNSSVELLNEVGQVIKEIVIANKNIGLDLTILPAGIYIARIRVDEQVIYKKIFKK